MKVLSRDQLPEDIRAMLDVIAEAESVIRGECVYLAYAFRFGRVRWTVVREIVLDEDGDD
jgi:hypothetical protein